MAQKLETDKLKSLAHILDKASEIAVLPQVLHQLLEITDSVDGSPSDIEKAVAIDPGFSAKLIAMANSAQFSLPKKVTSIREACMLLGFRQIREVALSAGVFDLFIGKNDKESIRRRDWWKLSVDTAMMARWVAGKTGQPVAESYTCGLLHLIGKTVIDQSDPEAYDKVMHVAERGAPEQLAERIIFAADHIDVAQEMARRWRFPELLVQGLDYLNPPSETYQPTALGAVVHVADSLVRVGRHGRPDDPSRPVFAEWATQLLNIDPVTADEWIQSAHAQFLQQSAGGNSASA